RTSGGADSPPGLAPLASADQDAPKEVVAVDAAIGSPPSGASTGAALAVRDLSKTFPDGTVALDGVSLDVAPGEFMVVLGPTGCGKTTLLRLIAGLERPTRGHVLMDGVAIDGQPAQERRVAMVFQESALYPHLTVAEN